MFLRDFLHFCHQRVAEIPPLRPFVHVLQKTFGGQTTLRLNFFNGLGGHVGQINDHSDVIALRLRRQNGVILGFMRHLKLILVVDVAFIGVFAHLQGLLRLVGIQLVLGRGDVRKPILPPGRHVVQLVPVRTVHKDVVVQRASERHGHTFIHLFLLARVVVGHFAVLRVAARLYQTD